ncbi:MAG: tRNA pseudouridine(13) synthase TruD [Moraxellaceae bacterium]
MDWTPFLLESQPHAHAAPTALATLRAEPEDFQVDEIPGFVPSGEGEHVFLKIRKRNQNTAWVAGQLAKAIGLRDDAVSYAGLKDRRAVTTQWFSVHIPNRQLPDFSAVWNEEIELLEQTWNARKLKRGAHQGNRFGIVLRDVAGERSELEARLARIAQDGVPNYVGPQRFGHGNANLPAGELLLAGKPRRHLNSRDSIALSAVRSAFFNAVLGQRVNTQSWNHMLPGDVLMLDGRGSFFRPDAGDEALPARVAAQELHPTGPLPGRGEAVVEADVLALESAILQAAEDLRVALARFGVDAQRRALRLKVSDLVWEWRDESSLHLAFALPSGAFATSVLRELVQLRDSGNAIPVE